MSQIKNELLNRLKHPGDCSTEELLGYLIAIGFMTSYIGPPLFNYGHIMSDSLIKHLKEINSELLGPAELIILTLATRTISITSTKQHRISDAATGIICFTACPLKTNLNSLGWINEQSKFPPEPSAN